MAFSLAGRDDADDIAFRSIAMADHEQSQAAAQPEQDKSVFFFGVVQVAHLSRGCQLNHAAAPAPPTRLSLKKKSVFALPFSAACSFVNSLHRAY